MCQIDAGFLRENTEFITALPFWNSTKPNSNHFLKTEVIPEYNETLVK